MPWENFPTVILSLLYGLIVGSFQNVCIYRLPRGESIVWPGSYCPICQHNLAWFDNIPLLSFIFLSGHCRYCHKPISWQYPFIELLNALLWVLAAFLNPHYPQLILQQLFISALIVLSVIDLKSMIIPDEVNLFIAFLGLVSCFVYPELSWQDRLWGCLAGGGSLLLVGEISFWLLKVEGMGGGDIKFLAAAGLMLGWRNVILVFFLSAFVALPFIAINNLVGKKIQKHAAIPYGPSLAIASLLAMWWGETMIATYLSYFGL